MCARHLDIQNEGSIGIKLLLKLMQLCVAAIPGPRLIHYQQYLAAARIKSKEVDYGWIGDTGCYQSVITHELRLSHSECSRGISGYFPSGIARDVSVRAGLAYSLDVTKRPLRVVSVGGSLLLAMVSMHFVVDLDEQFKTGVLADDSYWADRQDEFDDDEGQLMR